MALPQSSPSSPHHTTVATAGTLTAVSGAQIPATHPTNHNLVEVEHGAIPPPLPVYPTRPALKFLPHLALLIWTRYSQVHYVPHNAPRLLAVSERNIIVGMCITHTGQEVEASLA